MIGRLCLALMFAIAPLSAAEPIRVLVFTTTDCPISNRYAPEIQRLAAKFSAKVKFVLVYPVPTDSPAMIREHAKKFAYSIETLRDTDRKLVKQTGVTVTPEVAVMVGDTMVYRGRIDDRYIELGKERLQPTQRDLESALDALMTGKRVAQRDTRAVGCILADLLK
jgi:thiol-disulfide isomerase/thioredoxin